MATNVNNHYQGDFARQFKTAALVGNRVQRHLPVADGGDGTLANDAAINAFNTKGLDGNQAALAYAVSVNLAGLADAPAPGDAVNFNYREVGGPANRNYNLRNDAELSLLMRAKAERQDLVHDID